MRLRRTRLWEWYPCDVFEGELADRQSSMLPNQWRLANSISLIYPMRLRPAEHEHVDTIFDHSTVISLLAHMYSTQTRRIQPAPGW